MQSQLNNEGIDKLDSPPNKTSNYLSGNKLDSEVNDEHYK